MDNTISFTCDSLNTIGKDGIYKGRVIVEAINTDFTDEEIDDLLDAHWDQVVKVLIKDKSILETIKEAQENV